MPVYTGLKREEVLVGSSSVRLGKRSMKSYMPLNKKSFFVFLGGRRVAVHKRAELCSLGFTSTKISDKLTWAHSRIRSATVDTSGASLSLAYRDRTSLGRFCQLQSCASNHTLFPSASSQYLTRVT